MKRNMRVLHILCSNKYSGAENVVCQIIHMFKNEDNFEFIYSSLDGEIRSALKERKINFVPMEKITVSEIKRVIKETNPGIIHAHDMKASFFAAMACGKIPLITHIHNNNYDSRKPTLKAMLYRFAAQKSKHIFWVSRSSFDGYYFHEGLKDKSTVLYNVIDSKQLIKKAELAEKKDRYDVVYLGRLTYQKDPQRVINVLEKVVLKYPKLKAAVIGTGELENEVKELIKEKGLGENIHVLGFMSNPYGILQNSKIMLMTSRWEGTPMCGLEAIALGIPIVSTPTDGLKELVESGKTGYLSEYDEKLANYIYDLIINEEKLLALKKDCLKKNEEINNSSAYKELIMRQYNMQFVDNG